MVMLIKISSFVSGGVSCVKNCFTSCRKEKERWNPHLEKVLSTVNAVDTERGRGAGRALAGYMRRRNWELGKMLGRGTTSRVFEIGERTGSFALKLLRFSEIKPTGPDQGEPLGIGLSHPNLLSPVQILYYDGSRVREERAGEMLAALMPVCGGVDLHEALAARRYSLKETAQIGVQICRALRYLHRRGVIHCDLNLQNIRVFADLKAVLCDLGLARKAGARPSGDSSRGTLQYASPQRFVGNDPFSPADDAYSFGVLLHRIFYGKFPVKDWPKPKEREEQIFQDAVEKLTAGDPAARMGLAAAERLLEGLLEQDFSGAVESAHDHPAS